MSQSELEVLYGQILSTSEGVSGIIWIFREKGFYPTTAGGDYIGT